MESTIDEPIWDTIRRDSYSIMRKVRIVAVPFSARPEDVNELRDWDLWGPLLLSLLLAFILTSHHEGLGAGASVTFAAVFVIVSVGSAIVTLNAKFLGGRISFFQTTCTLGYCLFPLVLVGLLLMTPINIEGIWAIKISFALVAWAWATYASLTFIGTAVQHRRRKLAVYPIALFYFFLAWMLAVSM